MKKDTPLDDNVISDQYRLGAYFYDLIVCVFQFFVGGAGRWRKSLVHLAAPHPGERILELCCGTASVSLRIVGMTKESMWASDLSSSQIRVAKLKAGLFRRSLLLTVQDASSTDYADAYFDKIIISGALHEIRKPRRLAIYREVRRILKDSGAFFVSEPDLSDHWWGRGAFETMFGTWNREHETAYELIGDGITDEISGLGFKESERATSNFGFFTSRKFVVR